MIIGNALARVAKVYPDKVAVIDKHGKYWPIDSRYTYSEVIDTVNRLANSLLAIGLEKGDRVALLSGTKIGFYLSYLAIINAGLVVVPSNVLFGGKGREFIHIINDSEARALIVDGDVYQTEVEDILSEVGCLEYVIGMGEGHGCQYDWDTLVRNGTTKSPDTNIDDEDLAMLLYTSGTTGLPKGAMLTHRNVCTQAYIWAAEYRILPHYKFLLVIPSATSGGIGLQTICVLRGMTLVLTDFEPQKVLEIIQQENIDSTMFAPTMIARIVRYPNAINYNCSSLKSVVTSTAPISGHLVKEASKIFGDVINLLYGTTETGLLATFLQPEERALEGPLSKRLTSVGKANLGYEIKVIDDNNNEVKPGGGVVGELLVKGDPLALGYWNMPDSPDFKNGWWYSGDLATVDKDGYIYIMDRKKDMILSGGLNIYAREVEDVISSHPDVHLVAVIGVPDEEWGEAVKAVIVPKEEAHSTEQDIIDFCKTRLASYKKPRSIDFINISEMPLMGGGYKVLKRELRDKYRKKYMKEKGIDEQRWGVI